MTIRTLLVDDDPDTRAIVALALDLHPQFAVSAVSRLGAADTLRHGTEAFDVILLDMKFADMSAGALVATVRQWSSSAAIPVLILSPRDGDSDRRAYRSVGAQGSIAKPFDPVALPDRVIESLRPFSPAATQRSAS
ncbi:MAG: response regulator [Sphingomonas sp.]|uniref:response regulator n=1 Tax=Sphingomonas sp. TaxID=28214 RepID=UPI001ACB2F8E|nr:response regulator [Sphingomonas sp.]MBN8815492.1 response regulator [Sphingomonas sp.]